MKSLESEKLFEAMMRNTALFCLPLCALVADSVILRHSSRIDTRSKLLLDFPFYHTSDQIQKEARELVAGCSAKATVKTVTRGNVSLDYVRVSGPGPSSRPNRVAFLFGEHSRELISPESGLMLLKMLCGPSSKSDLVKKALDTSDFQLILNANPISRARVEQGDYCLRDNPRGVDLNRSWDEKWELGDQVMDGDQYHGEKPFSEVETQMVRDLVTEFKPTTFLSVHSGTLGLYMPWAYDSVHMAHRNRDLMLSVLKEVDEDYCQCPFGAAGKEVGYNCPGTSFDWVYDNLKAPFSFAWEIYARPAEYQALKSRWQEKLKESPSLLQGQAGMSLLELYSGHFSDFAGQSQSQLLESSESQACFDTFNPGSEQEYNESVTNWATSYLKLAVLTAPHVALLSKSVADSD